MEEIKYQVTAAKPISRYVFEVATDLAQIELNITTSIQPWYHIFVLHNGQQVGQVLITHKQVTRQVLIGKTVATSCATVFPQGTLIGQWEIVVIGSQLTDAGDTITIQHLNHQITDALIDNESSIDIVHELAEISAKSGWVKGDFHTHTIYSDGAMTRQANIDSALTQNLDFFVTTEHNVVTALWPKQAQVSIYGGCELTTLFGHTNFLGLERPLLEFPTLPGDAITEENILAVLAANRGNGLMSINHPFLEPWAWSLDVPLADVASLELINDPTYSDNNDATIKAFKLWSALWNHGWQITGIAGSDSHLLPNDSYPDTDEPSLIGDPATYVHVPSLTRANLLAGITAKRTMISRIGIPSLSSNNMVTILPGMQLTTSVRTFEFAIANPIAGAYTIEWIFDGQIVHTEVGTVGQYVLDDLVDLTTYHWLRADVKDNHGVQVATFTPVYWGTRTPDIQTYREVLVNG